MSWTNNAFTSFWNGAFNPDQKLNNDMDTASNVRDYRNQGFRNDAQKFGNYINTNVGVNGYNTGYEMAQGKANDLTNKQASQAGAQSVTARQSAGMNRGRASMDAGADTANTFAQQYGANMNNQQNAANQQLANQLNAQGTLMGANLTNDQAEYQQAWNNQKQGGKANNGLGGFLGDVMSDEGSKNIKKVGLPDKDLRMVRYEKCGEKLRHMNPNRWEELKWRMN